MNKIDNQIRKIKKEKRLGLMTHVVVGYPSLAKTISIVKAMEKVGSDFAELQIPFSDPLADGSTIMQACEQSLLSGTKVKDAFNVAQQLSQKISIPLLFMAYYNTIFKYGTEKFCRAAKQIGISGLIVPDIPIEEEECEHFMKYCDKYDLKHIRVVSPASNSDRLKENARVANGFIYFTARQGTTGAKDALDSNLIRNLKKIRRYFSIPIAVGFGISKGEHLQTLKPHADIAVVGSAIIDIINKSNKNNLKKNVESFIKVIKL